MTSSGAPAGRLRVSCSPGKPVVLALAGELDAGTVLLVVRAVGAALDRCPAPRVLLLDLAEVHFLGAAGVRVLCEAADHAAALSARLRIVTGGNPVVSRALLLTGANRVLDSYPDRAAALSAGDGSEFLRLTAEMWNS
ncbi:anti-anti-sigma factor [Amycolatopsis vancoresmycina DSM 44592]|uniref:Anti-anti-sigma factor n=1 Tax=Amycolatopsis vancoresmycina DSM 44592 TaxID=1292037 RepID=R1G3L9_9PSEU|nr:STAS domain-containing protein [Amycolatopsis vancoresmycina]EOD66037.1 anti-anti-sigma factor [Amycolatopsis vancoresmycina DSM 44592]